jgi:DNA-binding transcriptional ArsR family regulator
MSLMLIAGLIEIYQCFCDETRLRILNLLTQGPLCVCHLQEVLDEPQVKISKHLSYLKGKAIVDSARHQNWMIYSLPAVRSRELEANLKCLQDCVQTHPIFKADLRRLAKLKPKVGWVDDVECCGSERSERTRRTRSGGSSSNC